MMHRLFVDTNILLDAAMGERPGWAAASILIDEFAFEEAEGFISAVSLKDVYYVLSKYSSEVDARKFVLALMDVFEVVPVDYSICRTSALSDEPDFEDGIIRACAETTEVDFIISRDEKAFLKSPIRRLMAQEYVDLFVPIEETEVSTSS